MCGLGSQPDSSLRNRIRGSAGGSGIDDDCGEESLSSGVHGPGAPVSRSAQPSASAKVSSSWMPDIDDDSGCDDDATEEFDFCRFSSLRSSFVMYSFANFLIFATFSSERVSRRFSL